MAYSLKNLLMQRGFVTTVNAISDWRRVRRAIFVAVVFAAFCLYVSAATFSVLVFPPALLVFVAPIALVALAYVPQGRAAPRRLVMPLIIISTVLFAIWPPYIHLKLGPAPILTPPRLMMYIATAIWLHDMVTSSMRRAQLAAVFRGCRLIGLLAAGLFVLNFLSLPMAVGRSLAAQEFLRQVMIWFIPFCIFATYIRSVSDFRRLLAGLTIASAGLGIVAILETGSGVLLASKLAPLISGNDEWLYNAQSLKIRDGLLRAQATHTHPLSLGEMLAMTAPLALGFSLASREMKARLLWSSALIIICTGALVTNSRGPVLAIIGGLGVVGVLATARAMTRPRAARFRPLIGLIASALIAASPVMAVSTMQVVQGEAGTQAARSSESRQKQIEDAWPKIMKRPVAGYGTGRATRILGYWGQTLTIDNFYLSLALDLGLPGPIVFFSLLIGAAYLSTRLPSSMRHRITSSDALMFIGFSGSMVAVALVRSIISQTGNLAILFAVLGAFAAVAAATRVRTAASLRNDTSIIS